VRAACRACEQLARSCRVAVAWWRAWGRWGLRAGACADRCTTTRVRPCGRRCDMRAAQVPAAGRLAAAGHARAQRHAPGAAGRLAGALCRCGNVDRTATASWQDAAARPRTQRTASARPVPGSAPHARRCAAACPQTAGAVQGPAAEADTVVVGVLPGPHANPDYFTDEATEVFYASQYQVRAAALGWHGRGFVARRWGVRPVSPQCCRARRLPACRCTTTATGWACGSTAPGPPGRAQTAVRAAATPQTCTTTLMLSARSTSRGTCQSS
jgi:hypothetical protein